MKIVEVKAVGSFYESFSDLVFGVLVLFVVVVLALALKVQMRVESIEESAGGLISTSRFAGGSAAAKLYLSAMPKEGVVHLVFLPESVAQDWTLVQSSLDHDAGRSFCEWAQANPELPLVAVDELPGFAKGMGAALADEAVYMGRLGEATFLVQALRRAHGDDALQWSAEELQRRLGLYPVDNDIDIQPPSRELQRSQRAYWQWSYDGTDDFLARAGDLLGALREPCRQELPDRSVLLVRLGEDDGHVHVGTQRLSHGQLGGVLSSIRPGAGFQVELVDGGDRPMDQVDAFRREVLAHAGFAGRIIRESQV